MFFLRQTFWIGSSENFASLDGDADRIVFFGARNGLLLCDGDKIGKSYMVVPKTGFNFFCVASLLALFVVEQLKDAGLTVGENGLTVGIVQTA